MTVINIIGSNGYETSAEADGTIRVRPKWISVKDRLPDENDRIIIYNGKRQVTVGRRFIDKLNESGGFYCYAEEDESGWGTILKWMPLPEAPHE